MEGGTLSQKHKTETKPQAELEQLKKKLRIGSADPERHAVNDSVSLMRLKTLAQKLLPEDSVLRRLVMGEADEMPFAEWTGKVDIYARLLDDETKGLD